MITGNLIGGIVKNPDTIILIDPETGQEHPMVMLGEEVELTATTNDLRLGKTAAFTTGVKTGEKEIPYYNTQEGFTKIESGRSLLIRMRSDACQYTKFQAIVCDFNTDSSDSVAAVMVSINSKVYNVASTEELSTVVIDDEEQTIDLAVTNTSNNPVVIRYFTYKEIY